MELGKPIRTVVVEVLEAPKQDSVTKERQEAEDREECALPTTPRR